MSERPTPETDAAVKESNGQWSFVLKETCQRLERERDEAIADRDIARLSAQDSDRAHDRMVGELEKVYKERDEARKEAEYYRERYEQLKDERGACEMKIEIIAGAENGPVAEFFSSSNTPETDAELHGINAVCKEDSRLNAMTSHARKLERERDEAREALETVTRQRDAWALKCERRQIAQLERERDEAREALSAAKHYLTKERDDALSQIVQAECRAERFCQDRDEARAVIRMLWERAETHLDLSDEELDHVNRSWGESAK